MTQLNADPQVVADQAPPWSRTGDQLIASLNSSARGLTTTEASDRLATHGRNELEAAAGPSALGLLVSQFKSPLIYILLVAVAVTIVIGEYLDAAAITIVLLLNAGIGFAQEYRAEQALEALRLLAPRHALVFRDAVVIEVDAAELVPGDVIQVEAGMAVPADARLLETTALEVDQSVVTGESQAVPKAIEPVDAATTVPDRTSMVVTGSTVNRGRALAIVTATGRQTELGRIASTVAGTERGDTPLQVRMARLATTIGVVVLIAGSLGMLAGLWHGLEVEQLFLTMVALAVSAIPEGLPIVFTVALAIGLQRMVHRRVVIRRMPAVETLGSCDVIGSDKTGTLTENRMAVRRIVLAPNGGEVVGPSYEVTGGAFRDDGEILRDHQPVSAARDERLGRLLTAVVLVNDASLERTGGDFTAVGDPTETALLVASTRGGLDPTALTAEHPRVDDLPFESARRYAITVHEAADGNRVAMVKGAPERVLELSTAGRPEDIEQLRVSADHLASDGMRVLAVATRVIAAGESIDLEQLADFEPLGLVGSLDPPRAEAAAAVRDAQRAGVRILMITGDHPATAVAIADRIGLSGADRPALTGAQISELDDEELYLRLSRTAVCARVSPDQKYRIVTQLQAHGHVVAVTGDGVNDAPALKAADIGVAMGLSGTDVAREAGDMVITDDNFASIVAAIEEGRVVFDNVRKATFYLLSCNLGELIAVLASLFFAIQLPFLPAQLLWLNVVTDSVPAIALGFEPGEPDTLKKPPRPRDAPVISRRLWERTVFVGIWMAVGTLALFLYELSLHDDIDRARTVALTVMVLFQAFHVLNARSEARSVFSVDPRSNRLLLVGTLGAVSFHVLAMWLPPTQALLSVEPLDAPTWLRTIAVAASLIIGVELHKRLRGSSYGSSRQVVATSSA